MSAVAVLTAEQLDAIVTGAVNRALAKREQPESDILTREQAAALLQVHPKMVTRYVREKGLPGVKLGRDWRFKRAELVRWVEQQGGR